MSAFDKLRNIMRQEAQRATANVTLPRIGIVTHYDPDHYSARVLLQPEGIMTGYLPVTTPFIGLYLPPNIGDKVEVQFQQGGKEAGFIVNRFYSTKTPPIPIQAGDALLKLAGGSFIHMTKDGDVIVHAARRWIFDANGQGQIWDGSGVETWQDNDTAKPHHNHAPPKIPS